MSDSTRSYALASVLYALCACSFVSGARADQARDWMIAALPAGTDVMIDAIMPGAQVAVEHRVPIYGKANQLTLRGNALYTVPFYESQADAELRILVLTLGASGGFRSDFGHMGFGPDESIARGHRRERFVDGRVDTATWGFGEGRATLSLPFNDYFLFNGVNSFRFEGSPDRSFDFRTGVVHDGGFLFKSELMFFLKHRDWGGFAPTMQILNFGLGTHRFTQINYGATIATRPGVMRGDDILFLQVLFNPGSTFGSYDNSYGYGLHLLFAPIMVQLAYRMVLPVWRSE